MLAYYFCEPADACTAEEMLKSLIWQLTQEEHALATHAKHFTEKSDRRATFSVEVLWKSLQDMLSDTNATSRIYIVINYIHSLPSDSDATKKLLVYIKEDLQATAIENLSHSSVKWLFTSRKARQDIDRNLSSSTQVIDLDDDKYSDQVQLELRKHAQTKVAELSQKKEYKHDLAYFVSSLIGNRARKSGWVDITVEQLDMLPNTTNASTVRQRLKTLPQDLDDLLTESWEQVLKNNPTKTHLIIDMLRALVLTYEDPSLEELAILADHGDLVELRDIVETCSSFLLTDPVGESEVVRFKNDFVKTHLLEHSARLLGLSTEETQWQQGELALRSLAHLVEKYTLDGDEKRMEAEQQLAEKAQEEPAPSSKPDEPILVEDSIEENIPTVWDEYEDYEEDPEALPYMVKHWLHHASKSTLDLAEELSRQAKFWAPISLIRRRWLEQYKYISDNFGFITEIPIQKWTALHVASSFGYKRLVCALLENGHGDELNKYDDWSYAPVRSILQC